jgi:hypothetical protein
MKLLESRIMIEIVVEWVTQKVCKKKKPNKKRYLDKNGGHLYHIDRVNISVELFIVLWDIWNSMTSVRNGGEIKFRYPESSKICR